MTKPQPRPNAKPARPAAAPVPKPARRPATSAATPVAQPARPGATPVAQPARPAPAPVADPAVRPIAEPGRPPARLKRKQQPAGGGTGSRTPGVLSLVAVTLALGGIVAASRLVPVTSGHADVARALPLSLAAPELACPGPETLAVPDGGKPVAASGPVRISALVGTTQSLASAGLQAYGKGSQLAVHAKGGVPTGDRLRVTTKDAPAQVKSLALSKLGPVVLAGQSSAGSDPAPMLAATQSTLARTGDLRGLVSTGCTTPSASAWLIGGGTRDGERLRLVLSNPLQTPAVVDVEVHGPRGTVQAASGDGVVVPAQRNVVLYVDALAPGLDRVAVHVAARSGRVVATLHDALLRGLAPGGTDDVQASAAPSTRQVIPGVSLVNAYGKTASDPRAAGSTSVRITVPGAEEAVARVRLVDASGTVDLPAGAVVNVPAGGVVDVPLSGVPSRTYTAIVESDVPVVAGAMVGRVDPQASPAASEFGWAPAATPIAGSGYVVLPPDTDVAISFAAAAQAGQLELRELTPGGELGPAQPIDVPAGTSMAIRASSDDVSAIRFDRVGGGPVVASLVATADDARGPLISVIPVRVDATAVPRSSAVSDPRLGLG